MNVYAIFDNAAAVYMRPFFCAQHQQAVRLFEDESLNAETPIAKHPHDYSLWHIGTYDDSTGELAHLQLSCLSKAHEVVAKAQTVNKAQIEAFANQVEETNDA